MQIYHFFQDLYNREPLITIVIFASVGIFLLFLLNMLIDRNNKKKRASYLKSKQKLEPSIVEKADDEDDEPKSISQPGKPIQWVQIKKAPKNEEIKTIKELKSRSIERIIDPAELLEKANASTNSTNSNNIANNTNTNNTSEKPKEKFIPEALPAHVIANILVVDDALVIRKKISDLLKENQYGVITKKDGWEAFSFLNELVQHSTQKPDLIITDIEMPAMTGLELISAIKKIPALVNIPIIIVSSHVDLHLSLVQEGQINGFISKPFKDEDLINQIEYLLD